MVHLSGRKSLVRFAIYVIMVVPIMMEVRAEVIRSRASVGPLTAQQRAMRDREWYNDHHGRTTPEQRLQILARAGKLPAWNQNSRPNLSPTNGRVLRSRTLGGSRGNSTQRGRPIRPAPALNTNGWTMIGPMPIDGRGVTFAPGINSGRATGIAIDPNNNNNIYITAANGGVWASNNHGSTWVPIGDDPRVSVAGVPNGFGYQTLNNINGVIPVGAIAIDAIASTPTRQVIYVGTGEDNDLGFNTTRSGASLAPQIAGIGILRLEVNPQTMQVTKANIVGSSIYTGRAISRIVVDNTDTGVGRSAAFYVCSAADGLRVTTDEGVIFTRIARGVIQDFALDPVDHTRGYVGIIGSPFSACQAGVVDRNRGLQCGTVSSSGVYELRDLPTGAPAGSFVLVNRVIGNNGGYHATLPDPAPCTGITPNPCGVAPLIPNGFTDQGYAVRGSVTVHRAFRNNGCTDSAPLTLYTSAYIAGTVQNDQVWRYRSFQFNCLNPPAAEWDNAGADGFAGGPGFPPSQAWYDNVIRVDPINPNVVYLGGSAVGTVGVQKTITGTGFAPFGTGNHVDIHDIVIEPQNRNNVYIATDGGIFWMPQGNPDTDTGGTWQSLNDNLATVQFTRIDTHPTDPNLVIGGTQDNGTLISQGATNTTRWDLGDGGDGGYAIIDQQTPTQMFHTTQGVNPRRSTSSGVLGTWGPIQSGINTADTARFYSPFVMDQNTTGNIATLYFGTFIVYQTRNAGGLWTAISKPNDLGSINGNAAGSAIACLAVAPPTATRLTDGRTVNPSDFVYAGVGNGVLAMTSQAVTNISAQWVELATNAGGTPAHVEVDPDFANRIYFMKGGNVFTVDVTIQANGTPDPANTGGVSATNIGSAKNFPAPLGNVLTAVPGPVVGTPQLFAGTDVGVFVLDSVNASIWKRMENYSNGTGVSPGAGFGPRVVQSLPTTTVTDLKYNPNTQALYAATHGRSCWAISVPSAAVGIESGLAPVGTPDSVAVSEKRNRLYVTNQATNNVTVMDPSTSVTSIITSIVVGTTPRGLAINDTTNFLYVANSGSNNVSVIDTQTNTVRATIPVQNTPIGVAVDTNHSRVYVTNSLSNSVSVIDGRPTSPTFHTVVRTINAASVPGLVLNSPQGIAVNPDPDFDDFDTTTFPPPTDDSCIFVANTLSNNVSVLKVTSAGPPPTYAQAGGSPVAVGTSPQGANCVGVNTITNRIYVANFGSTNVSVIDGATLAVIANTPLTVQTNPTGIAANNRTNMIYVSNAGSNTVTEIYGSRLTLAGNAPVIRTVNVPGAGPNPQGIVVNTLTNRVFTANAVTNNVTLVTGFPPISGTVFTGIVTPSIPAANGPAGVGAIGQLNRVYVTAETTGNMSVIDGQFNTIIRNLAGTTITTGGGVPSAAAYGVAVNTTLHRVFVSETTNAGPPARNGQVTVMDGDSAVVRTIAVSAGVGPAVSPPPLAPATVFVSGASGLAMNLAGGLLYVANSGSNNVSLINPATSAVIDADGDMTNGLATPIPVPTASNGVHMPVSSNPHGCAYAAFNSLNTTGNRLLVACRGLDRVYLFDEDPTSPANTFHQIINTAAGTAVGTQPRGVAASTTFGNFYVTNFGSNTVTVVSSAGVVPAMGTIALSGTGPVGIAIVGARAYVANSTSNNVSIIDLFSNTEIDTDATMGGVQALPVGISPIGVGVNGSLVYVTNSGLNNDVTVINDNSVLGSSGATTVALPTTLGVSSTLTGMGVNTADNRLYVPNPGSNTLNTLDSTPATVASVNVGRGPFGSAYNSNNNRIYVANSTGNTVSVIDKNNPPAPGVLPPTINVGNSPMAVAVNATTNRIYVSNSRGNSVSVIDGTNNNVIATIGVGSAPQGIAVNENLNRIYVANSSANSVSMINGLTNAVTTTAVGTRPQGVAVIGAPTNRVYVTATNSNNVAVLDGATLAPVVGSPVAVGQAPVGIGAGVIGVTPKVFVHNVGANSVSVFNGATLAAIAPSPITMPTGTGLSGVAVNTTTNRTYVMNTPANLTVIDAAAQTIVTASVAVVPSAVREFIVTKTVDDGSPNTLRAAINFANNPPDPDGPGPLKAPDAVSISFQLRPGTPGVTQDANGAFVFTLGSALPDLTRNNIVIDGTTESNFLGLNPNTRGGPPIVINCNDKTGIRITGSAANSAIRGLVINKADGPGIAISGAGASGSHVEQCFIGTDSAGLAAQPNHTGILLDNGASNCVIGGTSQNSVPSVHTVTTTAVVNNNPNQTTTTVAANNGDTVLTVAPVPNFLLAGTLLRVSGGTNFGIANRETVTLTANAVAGSTTLNVTAIANAPAGGYSVGSSVVAGVTINVLSTAGISLGSRMRITGGGKSETFFVTAVGAGQIVADNIINAPGTGYQLGTFVDSVNIFSNLTPSNTTLGNIISGNRRDTSVQSPPVGRTGDGVVLFGSNTSNNRIAGNFIGVGADGLTRVANQGNGVKIIGPASNNTVGGVDFFGGAVSNVRVATPNLISGNGLDGAANQDKLDGNGVLITGVGADSNVVSYNLIGTNASGLVPINPNDLRNRRDGVRLEKGAKNNIIGDQTARIISFDGGRAPLGTIRGNVICGSIDNFTDPNPLFSDVGAGVRLSDPGTEGNQIRGNFVGIDVNGNKPAGSATGNTYGVKIVAGPVLNVVGGAGAGQGNVISGNLQFGVQILGVGTLNTTRNVVDGNLIGTDPTGLLGTVGSGANRGNGIDGVRLDSGAQNNSVGTGLRNIISANLCNGIHVTGINSSNNHVQNNFVGVDINGSGVNALGNGKDGLLIDGGASGTVDISSNVFSGNFSTGVHISGQSGTNTTNNTVSGNFIGTNPTGTAAIANGRATATSGTVTNGTNVTINVASTLGMVVNSTIRIASGGNSEYAVVVNPPPTATQITVDRIVNAPGGGYPPGSAVATGDGVLVDLGAQGNTVSGNTCSGNTLNGIHLRGILSGSPSTSTNTISNNRCGANAAGAAAIPNQQSGILVDDSAVSNTLSGNTLSGNQIDGLTIAAPPVRTPNAPAHPATASNTISGSFIGTVSGGAGTLPNLRDGVRIDGGNGTVAVTQNFTGVSQNLIGNDNVISGNVGNGVNISGPRAAQIIVRGNRIGLDNAGTTILTNNGNGVLIQAGANTNTIGDNTGGNNRNIISGNTRFGVLITGFATISGAKLGSSNNLVVSNFIGTDVGGGLPRGNRDIGVVLGDGAKNNTIGGAAANLRNVIASNNFMGLRITNYNLLTLGGGGLFPNGDPPTGNRVIGNFVGVDSTGNNPLGNSQGGPGVVVDTLVLAVTDTSNFIGGANAGEGNVVSGNSSVGIDIGGSTVGGALLPQSPPGRATGVGGATRVDGVVVQGNTIGLSPAGTQLLGNASDGILIGNGSSVHTIGGTAAGSRNIIGDNVGNGIQITGKDTSGNVTSNNVVQGNLIGLDVTTPLPPPAANRHPNGTTGSRRSGILISGCAQNNVIGSDRNTTPSNQGNFIWFNTQSGVRVTDGATTGSTVGNTIRGNSIQSNSRLGIDLVGGVEDVNGITANDTNDVDGTTSPAPNRLLNWPVLTGAANDGSNTVVRGQMTTTTASAPFGKTGDAAGNVTVDFYVSPTGTGDPSGNGQGQTYLGTNSQIKLQAGVATITATLPAQAPGSLITAICSDANGNSSEFSNICLVVSATGPTVKVTTTQDNGINATPTVFSLRAAINFANSNPGTTISFQIPVLPSNTQDANGAFVIQPPTPLPPITGDGTRMDGSLESVFLPPNPNTSGGPPIVISGLSAGAGATGLDVRAANCQIRNLVINNFGGGGNGIFINGTPAINTQVTGCWIGVTSAGTAAAANGVGVRIASGMQNTIGGAAALANVISGNTTFGVQITGANNNTVQGNSIGTNSAGNAAIANATGVEIDGTSQSNTIGTAAAANVLSGNTNNGVWLTGANVRSNVIGGNRIGVDAAGTTRLANDFGVRLDGAQSNTVGGAGGRNIISGNTSAGVVLNGAGTVANPNRVTANFIGTDVSGTTAIAGQLDGVLIRGGSLGNFIGGSNASNDQNTISGNGGQGVHLMGPATASNVVAANFIGTNPTGTAAIANVLNGVKIDSAAQNNTIGFAPAAGLSPNVISGNGTGAPAPDGNGIRITDANTSGHLVGGNTIGLNATGVARLANAQHGILIDNTATANTIGGDTTAPNAGLRNVISGNGAHGVVIRAAGTVPAPNRVQGNFIGTIPAGNGSLGNVGNGVQLEGGAIGNLIGTDGTTTAATGTNVGLRNVISGNTGNGIVVTGNGTLNNVIAGNFIGTDNTGAAAVANSLNGIFVDNGNVAAPTNQIGGAPTTPGPGSAPGNLISGNTQNGVLFTGVNARNNCLTGNIIGLNSTGAALLANGQDGVRLDGGAQSNTIGGTTATSVNVISGNGGNGVHIVGVTSGATTTLNNVQGNVIGLSATRAAVMANAASGVRIDNGAQNNIVGGTAAGAANRISGNTVAGVQLSGTAAANNTTSNFVQGNTIGDLNGTGAALPNGEGVRIDGGAQSNTIGGGAVGTGNVITANSQNGVLIRGGGTSNNVVAGNTIGRKATTDAAALVNVANGVLIDGTASLNTIGGTNTTIFGTGCGNIISGNSLNGVRISTASGNVLLGNVIGADTAGTAAVANGQNGVAIDTGAATNTVGLGTAASPGNLISGNTNQGVLIDGSSGNVAKGNLIGTRVTGSGTNRTVLANGGNGVLITNGAASNVIGDLTTGANTIAFNTSDGVQVADGTGGLGSSIGNAIRGNSIFTNGKLGINLIAAGENASNGVVTLNDALDADSGPNRLQNWPQLSGASVFGGNLTVTGSLDSALANSGYPFTIDIYASAIGDPSGNGEGATYVGTVPLAAPGNFSFGPTATAVTAGQVITSVATDSAGNSSEFSNICVAVGAANVIKVTTTDDNGLNATPIAGSLRKSLIDANNLAAAGGVSIVFQIPITDPGFNTVVQNVFTIPRPGAVFAPLPTITRNDVTLDGTAEAVFLGSNPNAAVGGPLIAIRGSAQLTDGLTVGGVTGTQIKNLNIFGFPAGAGIRLSGSSAVITGCWIGPTAAGAGGAANANQLGIAIIAGANANIIGGTTATDLNVIANNTQHGIQIASNNNVIQGNRIGTNPTGAASLPNGLNGIFLTGNGNTIGGVAAGGNLLSGNGNQAGATANGNGIRITGAAVSNQVVGNRIGSNDAATGAIANSQNGVLIDAGASANTIGVTGGATGSNVISGNTLSGVVISASNSNIVAGNFIGTRTGGTAALGNVGNGIQLDSGAQSNTIGGAADPNVGIPGNVISGNNQNGVLMTGANTGSVANPNVVQGNIIGANAAPAPGTTTISNGQNGVRIESGANGNLVGVNAAAPNALQGNLVSGNSQNGILITGANNTQVLGNTIGSNLARAAALANVQNGVLISGGASNNTIGDIAANRGNAIAFNLLDGVRITDAPAAAGTSINNSIRGNSIFTNGRLGTNLVGGPGEDATTGVTPNVVNHTVDGPNHFQNFPTLTSALLTGTTLTVNGSLDSTAGPAPNATYPVSLDVYASDAGNPSGNGEGQRYLGSIAAAGPGPFTFTPNGSAVTATQFITAEATDANGNSSEFSNVCPVISSTNAVLNVTNTRDSGFGSLRQAIIKANGIPGTSTLTIQFNIPGNDPGFANSVFNIQLAAASGALPTVTRANVIIDGATESAFLGGVNPNSAGPPLLLSGASLTTGAPNGIALSASGCEVRSLIINRFSGSGVLVQGNNCRVTGCYLGTDRAGAVAAPNTTGVTLSGVAACSIGGATAAIANLISGNTTQGVLVSGGGGNSIMGNLIGVNRLGANGDPLSNGSFGVFVQSASINNTIGGTNAGEGNLIAFNPRGGVIVGSSTSDASTGNRILRNSIFKNSAQGGLGIDLANDGVTQNDIGDSDSGPNNSMNFPLVTTVTQSGNSLTVSGTISIPNPANSQVVLEPITVDLFGNFTDNPSGFGEGGTWLASTNVNATGDWTATFTIPANATFFSRTNPEGAVPTSEGNIKYAPLPSGALTFITTMATDGNGNSSEFSKPRPFGGAVFTQSYPQGLNMLSIPRNLSQLSNNDLATLFKLSPSALRMALWDAATQQYQLFGQPGFTTLNNIGRGYFVSLTQPVTVSFSGQQFTRPFRWNLSQGWNLMGNMGDTDMRYVANQLTVFRNGVDSGTIDRTFQVNPIAPAIDPFVWIFDNPTNAYQLVHDIGANLVNVSGFVPAVTVKDRVPKGAGAWVFCRENNVALQFNDSIFNSPVLREGVVLAGRNAATSMDINRWAAQLAAQAGDARDGSAVFGVNMSTSGSPGFLAQKPPVPAIRSQFVRVTFERDSAGDLGYDIRPALNGNTHWNVNVTTNQTNEDVVLSWPKLSTLPRDLRLTLVDTTTGARQFMNTTSAYQFRASGSSPTRRLRIEVSTDSGGRLTLQAVNVQLQRAGTSSALRVMYSLNRDAQVTTRLINPAGKIITQLPPQPARTGLNNLILEAKDSLGRVPARGLYMLEITARADDGEEVKALQSAILR